jgi:dGTPase
VQRRIITRMIEDVIATSAAAITRVAPVSADEVRQAGETLIRFSPDMAGAERELKAFLFERVYRHDAVMAPVRDSEAVIGALFGHYMRMADLPGRWRERVASAGSEPARARIVCDFIGGMTDPYALEQHAGRFDAPIQTG